MDQEIYRDIIYEYLFPFMAEKHNYLAVLHQDNDPKHTSRMCKQTFTRLRHLMGIIQKIVKRKNENIIF